MKRRTIKPGERVVITLGYSEACMHMRVAGRRMTVEILDRGMVQLYSDDGSAFSFPITAGEAGIYHDAEGYYVTLDVTAAQD